MKTLIDQKLVCKHLVEAQDVMFIHATFFQLLGLNTLFERFPDLDENHKLFSVLLSILDHENKDELLVHFYDKLFAECITLIKALPELNASFFLEQIEKKRELCPFSKALDLYELLFLKVPDHILHDLTLHLAWDLICIQLASLFDRDISGLEALKNCLVESFQHITEQRKSVPSAFRFIEALYSYYLKKENLPLHTEEEWKVLCQGSIALKPRNQFIATAYIDVVAGSRKVLTLDSPSQVQAGINLAKCIFEKLKKEHSTWSYTLAPAEVHCLKETENGFEVESVLSCL